MTITDPRPAEEVEAAELEGFMEVGHDPILVALYAGYKTQRAVAAGANKIKGKLADKILEKLTEFQATCFTIGGQPMMRKQVVEDTTVLDGERLKAEKPDVYAEYCTKVKKGSVRVWVRPQNGDDVTSE